MRATSRSRRFRSASPEVVSLQQRRERAAAAKLAQALAVPAPAPIANFAGSGQVRRRHGRTGRGRHPPDTNGDVGPNHYIIAVNDAYGIYDKAPERVLAAFTENSLFSSGSRAGGGTGTGTLCDTNTFGDPVVLYDQLSDRWILTNLAFILNASTGLWVPPIYQCFAASKTGDPVAGGWWVYAVRVDTGGTGLPPVGTLDDYPKFGSWNDGCLYMGANAFNSSGFSSGAIFGSFNKSDMYNGLTLRAAWASASPSELRSSRRTCWAGRRTRCRRRARRTTSSATPRRPPSRSGSSRRAPNCGGGGTMGAATTVSHSSSGNVGSEHRAAAQHDDDSRQSRRPHHAEGAVSQDRQRRIAVGHPHRPADSRLQHPPAVGADRRDGRDHCDDARPAGQFMRRTRRCIAGWPAIAADTTGNVAIGYSTSNGTAPELPEHRLCRAAGERPSRHVAADRDAARRGRRLADLQLRRRPVSPLGRLQLDERRSRGRLHFWYTNEYYETQAQGSNQPGNWQTRIGSFKFPSCVPIYPVITCPANFTVNMDPGECGAVVNFTGAHAATATGNPDPVITYDPPSGSFLPGRRDDRDGNRDQHVRNRFLHLHGHGALSLHRLLPADQQHGLQHGPGRLGRADQVQAVRRCRSGHPGSNVAGVAADRLHHERRDRARGANLSDGQQRLALRCRGRSVHLRLGHRIGMEGDLP